MAANGGLSVWGFKAMHGNHDTSVWYAAILSIVKLSVVIYRTVSKGFLNCH